MHASEQFHYRGAISRGIYFLAEAAHCCKVVLWFLSRYCAIWLTDRYTSTMVERLSLCVVIGSSPTPKNHLQIVAKEGSFFGVYLRSFPTLIFHKDGSRQTTWGGKGGGYQLFTEWDLLYRKVFHLKSTRYLPTKLYFAYYGNTYAIL